MDAKSPGEVRAREGFAGVGEEMLAAGPVLVLINVLINGQSRANTGKHEGYEIPGNHGIRQQPPTLAITATRRDDVRGREVRVGVLNRIPKRFLDGPPSLSTALF